MKPIQVLPINADKVHILQRTGADNANDSGLVRIAVPRTTFEEEPPSRLG